MYTVTTIQDLSIAVHFGVTTEGLQGTLNRYPLRLLRTIDILLLA